MLRLVFVDASGWDYDAGTPRVRPLGGSQSAMCYLAAELARRGHRVVMFSGTNQPQQVAGVDCRNLSQQPAGFFSEPCDAVIVLNGPAEIGAKLRAVLPPATPLVLWTQHAMDQPAMQQLGDRVAGDAWTKIVCVSEWQRRELVEKFAIQPSRTEVLRNAIAPAFENLFASEDELVSAKSGPEVLAYTSTPFRGLRSLVALFPALHAQISELRLRVFSSMQVYQRDAASDPFGGLYDECRAIPGVEYAGSTPQPRLAQELKRATLLAYPSTFAETSCIAAMEALAAGLCVVTTNLGALPETTAGFAVLVEPWAGKSDQAAFAARYSEAILQTIERRRRNPVAFAAERWSQAQSILDCSTWKARAIQWENVLLKLRT